MEAAALRSPHVPLLGTATDESFEGALLSPDPVLLAFWAPWCAPCQTLLPTLEALATLTSGRLEVLRVDVDQSPRTAARFGVTNLPTVLLLENSVPLWSTTGIRPLEEYLRLLAQER